MVVIIQAALESAEMSKDKGQRSDYCSLHHLIGITSSEGNIIDLIVAKFSNRGGQAVTGHTPLGHAQ